jgi:hypothetical protein
VAEPNREKLRRLRQLPHVTKSKMLIVLLQQLIPYTLNEEPRRPKLRRLIELPMKK